MITVIGDLVADIFVRKKGTNYATDTDGSIDVRAGGQGNHVAAWIVHEGEKSCLIGKVGDDPFGVFLLDEAAKRGITCSVAVDSDVQTGKIVILVDEETGERSMVTDRGANLRLSETDVDRIEESALLYISGYSLFANGPRNAAKAAKQTAISHQIPVAVDPSSTYFLKEHQHDFLQFLEGVTFLFPNYEEGVLLTGKKEPEKILTALRKFVPCPVLKLGAEGCMLFENGLVVKMPGKPVQVRDTTGAGDSFIGSFLATYVKTGDLKRSAERAVEVSANVVTRIGGRPE